MILNTLTTEARDICIRARARQKDHFHDNQFLEDYIAFCKATDFEDIDAENFMCYTKIFGAEPAQRDRQSQSSTRHAEVKYSQKRRTKNGGSEKMIESVIEKYRVQMMRKMRHANK